MFIVGPYVIYSGATLIGSGRLDLTYAGVATTLGALGAYSIAIGDGAAL